MNPLSINAVPLPPTPPAPPAPAVASATSFKNILLDSIQQVNTAQQDAGGAVENLMTAGSTNPAEVLTALQKADLAFHTMMQIRNKLVAAYQEVKDVKI